MGILDWLIGKPKPKLIKWKGRPLYRIENRIYWKGRAIDDEDFEETIKNKDELRQYNYWVRKLNRRLRRRYSKRKYTRKRLKRRF